MIEWKLEQVFLSSLKGYYKNPRTLSEKEQRQLSDSIDRFGLIDKPIINLDFTIIGGHQRVEVMRLKGGDSVHCWVPSRVLDRKELEELNVRLNRNNGSWDYDVLANEFDLGDLFSWGFDEDELGLGKAEKPKKEPKPVISLEFSDKDTMLEYMQKCEEIAALSSAKMKVKG